jgi:hypothetical protein
MSLEKINENYTQIRQSYPHDEGLSPLMRLSLAIAAYILDCTDVDPIPEKVPANYITVLEFARRYPFVAPNTLSHYCREKPNFRQNCALMKGSRYYLHPERTLAFLQTVPRFRTRMNLPIFKEKIDANKK